MDDLLVFIAMVGLFAVFSASWWLIDKSYRWPRADKFMVALKRLFKVGLILNCVILFCFVKDLSPDARGIMLFGGIWGIFLYFPISSRTDPRWIYYQRTGKDRSY
jgi:hypothetical protein